ncbi:MAG: hypothetical protein HXS54_16605 [Theionarchaea archaeon]|nr:hypothetical protein [Theionarchaea archaeon]
MSEEETSKEVSEEETSESKVRNVKYVDFGVSNGTAEIEFKYESRIDYINPETEEPDFTYGLKNGIIWISEDRHIMIINVDDWLLIPTLVKHFAAYFDCKIETLYLTKEIINNILGKHTLLRGSYHHQNPAPGRVRNKTISDYNLLDIKEGRETDETYPRKSSFHLLQLGDIEVGTGVNEQYGRISFRKHLKKSFVRECALDLTRKFIEEMDELRVRSPLDYIHAIDPNTLGLMDSIIEQTSRKALLNIAGHIAEMKLNDASVMEFQGNITPFNVHLRNDFNVIFAPYCPECNSPFYKCNKCDTFGVASLGSRGFTVICRKCGKEFREVHKGFSCIEGHELMGSVQDNVSIYVTPSGRNLINMILKEKNMSFQLENNESVVIENNLIRILQVNYKSEYLFDEIFKFENMTSGNMEFQDWKIPTLAEIRKWEENNPEILENLDRFVDDLKEKCDSHGAETCRTCLQNKYGLCIQRMVASFSGGKLGPHHPLEYGDLSFGIRINGQLETVMCIIKSFQGKGKGSEFTPRNDGGLLSQVHFAANFDAVHLIAVTSGQNLEQRLKEYMKQIVEDRKKKIFFVERDELKRIAAAYSNPSYE